MSDPLYPTNDPYLASFVLSEGAVLAAFARLGPKRVEFQFVADRRLHHLLRLYWGGQRIPVAPVRIFAALKTLKSRSLMHS